MIDDLLQDWCDFCEGRKDFDKSHFYTLFMEEEDPKYFKLALQYFENSDDLLKRMAKIVCFGDPDNLKPKISSRQDALEFALLDLEERSKIAEKYDEPDLVEELSKLTPRFCENFDEVFQAGFSDLQSWQLEVIGDWFLDHLVQTEPKVFALLEAFYGFRTSLEIKWFLGAPLTNGALNLDNYAELWKAGADYAVKDGEILVGARRPLS